MAFILYVRIWQVKCYMHQLLSGLEHCHNRCVLHRDIKGSNLLIGNDGVLKIADFGLASFFDPNHKQPMTSRVVTLWYRPPELLLGATDYGVGVDLWSAGCILAELLAGKPIMPGRTEVTLLIYSVSSTTTFLLHPEMLHLDCSVLQDVNYFFCHMFLVISLTTCFICLLTLLLWLTKKVNTLAVYWKDDLMMEQKRLYCYACKRFLFVY